MKIGVDVGGSHVGLGLIDESGNLLLKKEKDYEKRKSDMSSIVLETIVELINEILEENSLKKEKIESLDCEIVHFFNKILGYGPRNITFFIVNGVIIGVGYEYAEGFSLFGEDY